MSAKKKQPKKQKNTVAGLSSGAGKEVAEGKYLEVINALARGRNRLRGLEAANELFGALKEKFCRLLNERAVAAESEMREAIDGMPWDRLVLAFFGETTAGKSTLVEMFRTSFERNRPKGRDGLIVGDGRQDFTRERAEYEMEIDGRPFVLVDAPGIEGKESAVLGAIEDSQKKIHCVFYVQAHNKKLEDATAKKIRGFLSDWVSVYSVQNVRGDASSYDMDDDRETLLTADVRKNDKLIQGEFKRILPPGTYRGNVPVQGLIALCSRADFAEECKRLKKAQSKLLDRFGSAEAMWEFSRAQELVDLVRELAKPENFTAEINAANARKVRKLAQNARAAADGFLKSNEDEFEKIREALNDYRNEIDFRVKEATDALREGLPDIVRGCFDEYEDNILFAVANGYSSAAAEALSEDLEKRVKKKAKKTCNTCRKSINGAREKVLKAMRSGESTSLAVSAGTDFSLDFSSAAKAFSEASDGEMAGAFIGGAGGAFAGAMIGSVVPVFGTIVGGVLGALGGGKFLSELFGDKEAARRKAREDYRIKMSGAVMSVLEMADELCGNLDAWADGLRSEADAELRNLDEMEAIIGDIKRDLISSEAGA